ncbi:hypothetical protein EGP64_00895 [bacterium]|nr:hypothetical protein [bacterium]
MGDFISLFSSKTNVMPKTLLVHFLSYMGFYVQVEDASSYKVYKDRISSFDIYLIDEEYSKMYQGNLIIRNIEKSILVYIPSNDNFDKSIEGYIVYQKDNQKFMYEFMKKFIEIYQMQVSPGKRLLDSSNSLSQDLSTLIEYYFSFNLLFHRIYGKFDEGEELGKSARKAYHCFIEKYNSLIDFEPNNYLLKSIRTHAKFDLSMIEIFGSFRRSYPAKEIVDESEELYFNYRKNEELCYLNAMIFGNINGDWAAQANLCADETLVRNPDALYQRGLVIEGYLKDYTLTILELASNYERWAIHYKKDFYQAWYELGICQELSYQHEDAYHAYEKVLLILNDKLQRHLLSPIEQDYLYCSIENIIRLSYSININGDIFGYQNLLFQVIESEQNNKYLETVFPNIEKEMIDSIKKLNEDKGQKAKRKVNKIINLES